MTLITFSDGKVVMRDGSVATGQQCCCDGNGECPPGCPSLGGCDLIVTLLYGEPLSINYGPATDYYVPGCLIAFEVADIPFESGGDISASSTVVHDENCDPVGGDLVITHSDDCSDPNVDCVGVSISFDCNAFP